MDKHTFVIVSICDIQLRSMPFLRGLRLRCFKRVPTLIICIYQHLFLGAMLIVKIIQNGISKVEYDIIWNAMRLNSPPREPRRGAARHGGGGGAPGAACALAEAETALEMCIYISLSLSLYIYIYIYIYA